LRNQSGYAIESESEGGAEKGSVIRNDGHTTGPQRPLVSLVNASGNGIVIVIGTGTETATVLGTENEIGIGHLVVVVGTAARFVQAAAVVVVVVVAAAAAAVRIVQATGTGHWLREWDSKVLLSGDRQHDRTDLHEFTTISRTSQL